LALKKYVMGGEKALVSFVKTESDIYKLFFTCKNNKINIFMLLTRS
jgi:hypothetical protein